MKPYLLLLVNVVLCLNLASQQIGKITAVEHDNQQIVIRYSIISNNYSDKFNVKVFCSADGGSSWGNPLTSVSGDVGPNISPGMIKEITWDVLAERNQLVGNRIKFKVVADLISSNSTPKVISKVHGKITDLNGDPLPGVIVLLKGTTTGVITDLYGDYTIQVPEEGGKLVFSYIGYTTQERSIVSEEINVALNQYTFAYSNLSVFYKGGLYYTPIGLGVEFSINRYYIKDLDLAYSTDFYNDFTFFGEISGLKFKPFYLSFLTDFIVADDLDYQRYAGRLSCYTFRRSILTLILKAGAGYSYFILEGPDYSTISYNGGFEALHFIGPFSLEWGGDYCYMFNYELIRAKARVYYKKFFIGGEYDMLDDYSEIFGIAGYTITF